MENDQCHFVGHPEPLIRPRNDTELSGKVSPHRGEGLGVISGDGLTVGLGVISGDGLAVGLGIASGDGLAVGLGIVSGDGLTVGLGIASGDGLTVGLGITSGETLTVGSGDGVGALQASIQPSYAFLHSGRFAPGTCLH